MIRILNFILLLTSVGALVGVYSLKFSVEGTAAEKAAVERTIQRQEGELSLLKADWAYLNQPSHVAPIIARHAEALNLAPVQQAQFGTFNDLPMRPAGPDSGALDALFESLAAGVDPVSANIEE